MPDFDIRITTDAAEVGEAQRLRFQVFNLEMKKGLHSSYERGLDIDAFDPFCEHLIVRDLKSRDVIGTYRLLLGSKARTSIGFYSEQEFKLEKIKNLKGELLELGRSCARKDFRDRALIPLMWEAIAKYVKTHHVRYLFGCGSLYTTDAREVSEYFSMLKRKYYAPEEFRVQPVDACRFDGVIDDMKVGDEHALFLKLPSLIKGYLRLGALVCGPPALDREFGTADFLVLLDIRSLSNEYLARFGLKGTKVQNAVG
jgi:L-ornithine Nalpha-acyltransferase